MQRLAGIFANLKGGAKSLGVYAGLGASLIAIYSYFSGSETLDAERALENETVEPAGRVPPILERDSRIDLPSPAPEHAQPTDGLTARIVEEVALRLASGNCADAVLWVMDAQLAMTAAGQTNSGFRSARITANLRVTLDGKTALLPVQGSGKGPSADGDAFAVFVRNAETRLSETFPHCFE